MSFHICVSPDDIINDNPSADALFTTERERCFILAGGEPLEPMSDDEGISKLKQQKRHYQSADNRIITTTSLTQNVRLQRISRIVAVCRGGQFFVYAEFAVTHRHCQFETIRGC